MMKASDFTISDFSKIQWKEYATNPILSPPFWSPILADPTFVLPENAPDQRGRLYAHSILGIHEWESKDMMNWKYKRLVISNAMRPYLFMHSGKYYLIFEKYKPFRLPLSFLPIQWYSSIQMLESTDLVNWKNLRTVLKPTVNWSHSLYGQSISNPCLIHYAGLFYLFFSASLVRIPDCGFNEPKFIGMAAAKHLEDEFEIYPSPIISPEPENKQHNLSSGSIKVIPLQDGLIGLQNRIYLDEFQKSRSAIFVVHSKEIFNWSLLQTEPILAPGKTDWMRSHVYACDFQFWPVRNEWLLYFNARSDWHWSKGKEKIGLYLGKRL